jgi:hypothetical protein
MMGEISYKSPIYLLSKNKDQATGINTAPNLCVLSCWAVKKRLREGKRKIKCDSFLKFLLQKRVTNMKIFNQSLKIIVLTRNLLLSL